MGKTRRIELIDALLRQCKIKAKALSEEESSIAGHSWKIEQRIERLKVKKMLLNRLLLTSSWTVRVNQRNTNWCLCSDASHKRHETLWTFWKTSFTMSTVSFFGGWQLSGHDREILLKPPTKVTPTKIARFIKVTGINIDIGEVQEHIRRLQGQIRDLTSIENLMKGL